MIIIKFYSLYDTRGDLQYAIWCYPTHPKKKPIFHYTSWQKQPKRAYLPTSETSTIHYNYEYDVHIIIERVLIDTE